MENEKMYENSCEECALKEIYSVPIVHCFECDIRICLPCKNKHSRSRVKKKHQLIRIDDTPEGVLLSFLNSSRTCLDHPKEEVVFQCDSHDVICCGVCAAEAHKDCGDVRSLVDASKKAQEDGLVKTMLCESEKVSERNRKFRESNMTKKPNKINKATLKKKIRELKQYTDRKFNEMTCEIEKGMDGNEEEISKSQKNIATKEYMNRKLRELLLISIDSKDNTRTYLNMKALQKILKEFELNSNDIYMNSEYPNFERFKRHIDDAFQLKRDNQSSTDNTKKSCSSTRGGAMVNDTNIRKPALVQAFPLDDVITFNDCTWLNEERIVLTDSSSRKLYSYFVYHNTLEEHFALPTLPWCIEALDIDTFAVSFHSEKMIRIYKVLASEIKEVEKLYVFNMCFDMQYIKDETALYVLFQNICGYRSAEIERFAVDPRKLGTFDPNDDMHIGKKLGILEFNDEALAKLEQSNVFRITKDRKLLILISASHEVNFIDIAKGVIISKYDPGMFNPAFVDSDNEGFIYVVWSTNSTIHMLSPGGDFIREILTGQDGLALPKRLYFNTYCDKFIVIDENIRNQLKLFNYH